MQIKLLRGAVFVFAFAFGATGLLFPQIADAKRNPTKAQKLRLAKKVSSKSKKPRGKRDRFPPLRLVNANNGERLSLRIYDNRGRTRSKALKELYQFLRCRRTGKRRQINWTLIQRLYSVSRHYRGRTIHVYSGFRHRRVARSKGSRHIRGMAIDFRVEGISKVALREYLRGRYKTAGVGYYPNSHFIHFDVRKKAGFWVDLSGPGQTPRYVKDAYAWLRQSKKRVQSRSNSAPQKASPPAVQSSVVASVGNPPLDTGGLSDLILRQGASPSEAPPRGIAALRATSNALPHARRVGEALRLPLEGHAGAMSDAPVPRASTLSGAIGLVVRDKAAGRGRSRRPELSFAQPSD